MADSVMKLGLVLSAVDKMSRVINTVTTNATKKFHNIERAMESVNKVSNRMFIAGGIAAAGIYKAVEAAEDDATSQARLKNVFHQMWGNSGAVDKAVEKQLKFADSLSFQIGVEHELINTVQAKLAIFKHLSNQTAVGAEIYERATKAAFDLGAVGFGEASKNAVILGKALDSPMTMLKALRKQGTVNDQDIINIQNIFKSKGLLEAQKAILETIERRVKGTGIATVKATNIMKVGFSEIVESIGGAFLPTVEEAKDKMVSVFQPTIAWINSNHKLIQTIAKVAVGMLALAAAMRIITFTISVAKTAMTLFNLVAALNPVGLVVLAIAALVAIVTACWINFETFRAVVKTSWETIKEFGSIIKDYVLDRIKGVISGLGSIGEAIGLLFTGKFSAAYQSAKKGVIELSGYDAKMKAATRIKDLATSVSSNYNTRLLVERNAGNNEHTASSEAINSSRAFRMTNSTQTAYSPIININGSGITKDIISSVLNNDKRNFDQLMKDRENRNKRLNFAQ